MNESGMNDGTVMEIVGGSLGGTRMERPLDEITARGRGIRKRRRSIASAAAVSVLGVSLAVALPLSGSSGQPVAAHGQTQSQAVNVDLAAWSVHTNADSTVTMTVRQFHDPQQLRQVLARAGVRAIVTEGASCAVNEDGMPQISKVFDDYTRRDASGAYVVTISPAAMPTGSVLVIHFTGVGTPNWVIDISLHENVHMPPQCTMP
jgi:hypothetical protein